MLNSTQENDLKATEAEFRANTIIFSSESLTNCGCTPVCPICPTGATGPAGDPPRTTSTTGATGTAGASAIIPFASGFPDALTTVLSGLVGTVALVGFGNSTDGVVLGLGPTIDITGAAGASLNFAFSIPRTGTITSISAYFSTVLGLNLISTAITITATLYTSPAPTPNNVFSPLASVALPVITNIIPIGTVRHTIATGLSIPVNPEDHLLMVFSAAVTAGLPIATTVAGYASAGVAIS